MGTATKQICAVFLLVVAALLAARTAGADTLDDVKKSGILQWGGDAEGGAPYVFPRQGDPSKVSGFEVELADEIATHLKVRAEFAQGNWDKMPDLLKARRVQVVLNGYEWTPLRAEQMEATLPYYVYALQLLTRATDPTLRSWADLRLPKDGNKRKVGVLAGSSADSYVTSELGDSVEIARYDGNTHSMRETETGKLDACVQDTPIATFYAPRFPKLHSVGEPVAPGYYVIYARKGDAALVRAMNEAIVATIRSGTIERIYRTYGIWDARQEQLAHIAETSRFFGIATSEPPAPRNADNRAPHTSVGDAGLSADAGTGVPERAGPVEAITIGKKPSGLAVVRDYAWVMLQSAGLTVVLAVLSFPIAIFIGILVAVGRTYGAPWMRAPLTLYVEVLRGTPLMLQLYFVFFFLPEVGIRVPAFTTAILGLAINYSAYESEVYRAGLQAIAPGQLEAALSLGMSRSLAIRRIVVPQAARLVIPAVVNDFIALFKDTSVCSVVTLVELTKRYSMVSLSTQATAELMVMTAVLYLIMSYPLSLLARSLELRLGQIPHP